MIKEVNQKGTEYDFHDFSLSTGKFENFTNSNSEFLFVYHLIDIGFRGQENAQWNENTTELVGSSTFNQLDHLLPIWFRKTIKIISH